MGTATRTTIVATGYLRAALVNACECESRAQPRQGKARGQTRGAWPSGSGIERPVGARSHVSKPDPHELNVHAHEPGEEKVYILSPAGLPTWLEAPLVEPVRVFQQTKLPAVLNRRRRWALGPLAPAESFSGLPPRWDRAHGCALGLVGKRGRRFHASRYHTSKRPCRSRALASLRFG